MVITLVIHDLEHQNNLADSVTQVTIRTNRTTQIKSKALAIAASLAVAGTLITGSAFFHVHITASRSHTAAIEYMDSTTASPNIEYMDPYK